MVFIKIQYSIWTVSAGCAYTHFRKRFHLHLDYPPFYTLLGSSLDAALLLPELYSFSSSREH
ncbi:hypothetical protein AN958_12622 [Leucoagaricus sp. SymC.cos]|nr:hypothetical protein AN958_12622 [Leucoagaricus sp. SymC.cos]